jgi:TorA maturation chaperone TorD
MELFRALAALAEPPVPELAPLAAQLGLGELPAAHEHTELFTIQLVPYASIYLGEDGRLGGDARDRIQGFWRALGRAPEAEADHLTLMLASFAELGATQREAERSGNAEARQQAVHHQTVFLHEHILSWLPAYLLRASELGGRFYGNWARLLLDLLEREAEAVARPNTEPMHFRLSTPIGLPDSEAGDILVRVLDALVAPIRCGFVITRRDLADAAAELGIGCRMGERRYMLEAMLRQQPATLTAWLTEYCERVIAAYAEQPEALRQALSPWSSRAGRVRATLQDAFEGTSRL